MTGPRDRLPGDPATRRRVARAARAALAALLAAAAVASPFVVSDRDRAERATLAARERSAAREASRRGRPEEAIERLERALALHPGDPALHFALGAACEAAGDVARARAAYEAAWARDPDAVDPRVALASLLAGAGEVERAQAHVDWLSDPARAARVRPHAGAVALLACRLARGRGDVEAARRAAAHALGIAPRSLPAIAARVEIALGTGEVDRALDLARRATAVAPGDPEARVLLSRALELAGDLEGALAALDAPATRAVPDPSRMHPRRASGPLSTSSGPRMHAGRAADGWGTGEEDADPPAAARLALRRVEVLARLGRAAEATAAARELPETAGEAAREHARGLAAAARGDLAGAAASFRRALGAGPEPPGARLELGRVLARRGETAAARAELERVPAGDPEWREARLELARLALATGEAGEAAAGLERVVALGQDDAGAVRLLVAARTREGRPEEARRFLEARLEAEPADEALALGRDLAARAALDRDPKASAEVRLLARSDAARGALEVLADGYALERDLALALDRLRAIPADARLAPARLELVETFRALGRLDLAEAEARAVVVQAPHLAAAHLALARVLEAKGDLDGACDAVETGLAVRPGDTAAQAFLAGALLRGGRAAAALEVSERALPSPGDPLETEAATALALAGFRAAVELGDLERAAGRLEAAGPGVPPLARATALAAAAFALGRDREAAAVLEPWLGGVRMVMDHRGRPHPDPLPDGEGRREGSVPAILRRDAHLVGAALAYARGDLGLAVDRARRADAHASFPAAVILVDALLAAGDGEGATRTAAVVARTASAQDVAPAPLIRALRERAGSAGAAAARPGAAAVHRLLVAAAHGLRGPARRQAETLTRGAASAGSVLGALVAARVLDETDRVARGGAGGRAPADPFGLGGAGSSAGGPRAREAALRYHLGLVYARLGQGGRALAELDRAQRLAPDAEVGRAAARARADLLEELGRRALSPGTAPGAPVTGRPRRSPRRRRRAPRR